jgi:hypothetical protein
MYPVRGYQKPEATFHTINEWEAIANEFLKLQKQGYDVRGGIVDSNAELVTLIRKSVFNNLSALGSAFASSSTLAAKASIRINSGSTFDPT